MGVSGEKHVCPATFFNQLHQCLTPRIARVYLDAGALRERGIDFVKRIFHRRSGENSNFPLLRKNWWWAQGSKHGSEADSPAVHVGTTNLKVPLRRDRDALTMCQRDRLTGCSSRGNVGLPRGGASCVVLPVATGRKGTFPIACSIDVGFGVGLAEWGVRNRHLRCKIPSRTCLHWVISVIPAIPACPVCPRADIMAR